MVSAEERVDAATARVLTGGAAPRGKIRLDRLKELISRGELETVIVAGVDLQGRLFGKRLEATHFLEQDCAGTMACMSVMAWDVELQLVEGLSFCGWHTGYHDAALVPDYDTIRLIPWFEKTALVLCDVANEDGSTLEISPRTILRRQLERAADLGYEVYSASELEFHLLRETPASAREKGYVNLRLNHDYLADYNLFRASQEEWLLGQFRSQLTNAGVPIESSKPEYGNGQFEVNLAYSQALEMADRHALYKQGMKEIAVLNDVLVTFMAKPFTEHSGSSCHTHMSLWSRESGQNLFYDEGTPYGMSDLMRWFLGGLMHLAADFFLLYAPYVNSYKRFVAGSFAPSRNVWGIDNRTVAFRACGHGRACRLENRIPGADVNGYLAQAAMLASGLYGVEHRLEPLGEPGQGNAYHSDAPLFPRNLVEATERFTGSAVARRILGEAVVDDLAAFARLEIERYFSEVTDWERKAYLELI